MVLKRQKRATRKRTYKQKQKQKGGQTLKLALCIPCHTEDLDLIDVCFKSIKTQERAPDIICISVSSSTPEKEVIFNEKMKEYDLSINFIFTSELLYPGANRNRAAEKAYSLGATHISFFDFDDVMHPKRLDSISRAFKENPQMVGFVHGFQYGVKGKNTNSTKITSEPLKNIVYFDKVSTTRKNQEDGIEVDALEVNNDFSKANKNIPQGHSSITSKFWKENPFNESLRTGEDGSFIAQVLLQNLVLGFNPDPLTLYLR